MLWDVLFRIPLYLMLMFTLLILEWQILTVDPHQNTFVVHLHCVFISVINGKMKCHNEMFMNHQPINLGTGSLYLSCHYKLIFDMSGKTQSFMFINPHAESLACKWRGTSSKVNLKLQICWVIYRVILLGVGVRYECFGGVLACMNKEQMRASGKFVCIMVKWNRDGGILSYLYGYPDKKTHMYTLKKHQWKQLLFQLTVSPASLNLLVLSITNSVEKIVDELDLHEFSFGLNSWLNFQLDAKMNFRYFSSLKNI